MYTLLLRLAVDTKQQFYGHTEDNSVQTAKMQKQTRSQDYSTAKQQLPPHSHKDDTTRRRLPGIYNSSCNLYVNKRQTVMEHTVNVITSR